jgi:hypothetical protein
MKLSEAIREGSRLTSQAFGQLVAYYGGNAVSSCALGSAVLASGGEVAQANSYQVLRHRFPILGYTFRDPVSGKISDLEGTIEMLNDFNKWTREDIAGYVEECEAEAEKVLGVLPGAKPLTAEAFVKAVLAV